MFITLYTGTGCGKCATIKALLANLKVSYAEKNIFTMTQGEIMEIGLKQIPSILVDGKLVYVGDKKQSELKDILKVF